MLECLAESIVPMVTTFSIQFHCFAIAVLLFEWSPLVYPSPDEQCGAMGQKAKGKKQGLLQLVCVNGCM